jgi:protease PrsW
VSQHDGGWGRPPGAPQHGWPAPNNQGQPPAQGQPAGPPGFDQQAAQAGFGAPPQGAAGPGHYLAPAPGQPYGAPALAGQPPYGQAPQGQAPHGQPPQGQAPYGQVHPGQPPYGQAPYGQAPYGQVHPGQPPYGQAAHGQAAGQAHPPQPYAPYAPPQLALAGPPGFAGGVALPDPDKGRRALGLTLLLVGCFIGLVLNVLVFSGEFMAAGSVVFKTALIAYLPVGLYLLVPYIVDRYDPEPWWALAGVFLWGAIFATGVSALINSVVGMVAASAGGPAFGMFIGSAISAPIVEEATKGLAILGMVIFLRREFDGVVDGIIYGTFVAIGFAATENIIYYTRHSNMLTEIFVLRGVLTPWLHPLFTSMIGIGFGMAREHGATWAKVVFPFGGYCLGVFLHAWWNGIPQLFPAAFILNLLVGILMALAFFVIVVVLVYRKGKTIKKYLEIEVLMGTISQEEFHLITSYGGRLKARLSWRGKAGADFVHAGARLALSKWHHDRAQRGNKGTISADFIVPLRSELNRLRGEMMAKAR